MADTDQFDDRNIIARTAYGENRSLGRQGMQATINSGQNRIASRRTWWGSTLRRVFLFPHQYDCWSAGDRNRSLCLSVTEKDSVFVIALELADLALAGNLDDITGGADSYVADTVVPPAWVQGLVPTAIIGNTRFFRTV